MSRTWYLFPREWHRQGNIPGGTSNLGKYFPEITIKMWKISEHALRILHIQGCHKSFGKKCCNVTTPGDNLQISSTKRSFIECIFLPHRLSSLHQGYFPDLIDQHFSADRYSCQRNSFSSAECMCRLHAGISMTLCAVWRKQTSARSSRPIYRTTPAWQLDHVKTRSIH